MSFQTGLSGLNASSRSLDVIGNNIANANTVGMKSSRTEFADLVASSLGAGGGGGAGIGVSVATISQQFSQGNINITGNDLDVAINGAGFFQLKTADGSAAYTRDGEFKLDKDGNVITNTGSKLMGYPTDPITGKATSTTIQALVLPTSAPIGANATEAIAAEFNLDARATLAIGVPGVAASNGPPATAAIPAIPPTPITTYGTSLTAFDSQGVEVPVSLYFVKVGPDPQASPAITTATWNVFDASTLVAGTAEQAANAAARSNATYSPERATNTATFATHISNAAYNQGETAKDVKNTAINAANVLLSATNDALNAAVPPPSPLLPSLTDGTIALLPVKGVDGITLAGLPDTMLDPDSKATYDNAGTGAYAADPQLSNLYVGETNSTALFQLSFDVNGKYITPSTPLPPLTLQSKDPVIGTFSATLDVSKVTQYGSGFAVSNLTQDGYASGELVGLKIGEDGKITARYSNGETQTNGQVALADFRNVQGLAPTGGGNWIATFASGEAVQGAPGAGKFGALRSGAVEESNVDLTAELVNMMTAQRAYQANAQTIKTQDQVLSTLVNLR